MAGSPVYPYSTLIGQNATCGAICDTIGRNTQQIGDALSVQDGHMLAEKYSAMLTGSSGSLQLIVDSNIDIKCAMHNMRGNNEAEKTRVSNVNVIRPQNLTKSMSRLVLQLASYINQTKEQLHFDQMSSDGCTFSRMTSIIVTLNLAVLELD